MYWSGFDEKILQKTYFNVHMIFWFKQRLNQKSIPKVGMPFSNLFYLNGVQSIDS